MFEAACVPKEQPDVPMEKEASPAQTHEVTTPTASSTSHAGSQDRTPTASEEASFPQFNESDVPSGMITSTPAAHRAKKQKTNIFSNRESPESSTTDESPHSRLRRQMESLHLESSTADISETSTSAAPISPVSTSGSSLSSLKSMNENREPTAKGKGHPQPPLRAKALQNAAFNTMQKAHGPIFTERPSASNYSPTLGSDISADSKHKLSPIFNPMVPPASSNHPPIIFTRPQQIFSAIPAPSSAATAQQRLLQNLLKEAEQDKRTGVPVGASLPARSPARFNALRQAVDTANGISLSTDEDTFSTHVGARHRASAHGNDISDGLDDDLEDSFSDFDEDNEEEVGDMVNQVANIATGPRQYGMENDSTDHAGWRPTENPDNYDGTTNIFGGSRFPPGRRDFQLRDVYRGAEPDSFVAETPIQARHAGQRHL